MHARAAAVRARATHIEGGEQSGSHPSCSAPVDRCAGCIAGVGGCSIDFESAPAIRGCGQPAVAPGTVLRDGEEARARPGTPFMHHLPAGAGGARRRQNTPCDARSRTASRAGRPRVGRGKVPAKRCVRPGSLAASRRRWVGILADIVDKRDVDPQAACCRSKKDTLQVQKRHVAIPVAPGEQTHLVNNPTW